MKSVLCSSAENINFLTADGKRFAHPLHHLGKSQSDLPLIAIDSFRHMYLFKNYKDIFVEGKLKSFVEDLHSGKLHRYARIRGRQIVTVCEKQKTNIDDYFSFISFYREFHYGPEEKEKEEEDKSKDKEDTKDSRENEVEQVKVTTPPESTFKKLAPSKNRYTLLRDEL